MNYSIENLYESQKSIWKEENEFYFGITPLSEWGNPELVKQHLDECANKFYNNGTCKFKELLKNKKCNDYDKLVDNSFELVFDFKVGIICLYATFKIKKIDKKNKDSDEIEKTTLKRAPLAYFPYPNDINWFIGETEYSLRIATTRNYSLLKREGNIVRYQRSWSYDISDKSFVINKLLEDFDPYENLTKTNREFLKVCYGSEITRDNFEDSLNSLPEYDPNSILYFNFDHMSSVFDIIATGKRFANPIMTPAIPIDIKKILTNKINRDNFEDKKEETFSFLVLSKGKISDLENNRMILYKNTYNSKFNFNNCSKFFDAFKTSTNKSAGRSRLILDDVIVKDHMLWNLCEDGEYHNMFEIIMNPDLNLSNKNNVSIISTSKFSENNDPKRIMMTAKLRAQAIPTLGEIDPFTHDTPARIVFGDFEGFNHGDSIIISKSFAKKLESRCENKKIGIDTSGYKLLKEKYKIGDKMELKDFYTITKYSNMYLNYRDIYIKSYNEYYIYINARIPFSVGDKITNLHGSKGLTSLIFEDEDMPYLENDIGENMKAGPFDIIVSALSIFKRKSVGSIFEAWSLASGHNDVTNITDAVKKYRDEMNDYSKKSIVAIKDKDGNITRTIKPCGINMFIRLDHNSVSKQSFSNIKSNYGKMLKFGEQELLNLASRGLYDIINEIDIRSITKHHDSIGQIKTMQKTGTIRKEPANNLKFFNILKTIGFDFNLRNGSNYINKDIIMSKSIINDDIIELFKDEEEGEE